MDFQLLADKALQGIPEREEMKAVLNASDEQIPELVSAAFKVRHYFGKRVHTCSKTRKAAYVRGLPLLLAIFRIRGAHRSLPIPLEGTTFGRRQARQRSRRRPLLHR